MAKYIITTYRQRFSRVLYWLRKEWNDGRRIRHAQCSGLILAQIAASPRAIPTLSAVVRDFVRLNGPEGLDGLFFTLLSATQIVDPTEFARSMGVVDNFGTGVTANAAKDGFGIFFLDLGTRLGGPNGRGVQSTSGGLEAALGRGFGGGGTGARRGVLLSSALLSTYPDSSRNSIFSALQQPFGDGMSIGNLVRQRGGMDSRAMAGGTVADRLGMSDGQCVSMFKAGTAIVTGFLGAEGGPAGVAAAATVGYEILGDFLGGMVCGMRIDDPAPSSIPPAPAGGGGAAGGGDGDGNNNPPPEPEPQPEPPAGGIPGPGGDDGGTDGGTDDDPDSGGVCTGSTDTYTTGDVEPLPGEDPAAALPGSVLFNALGIRVSGVPADNRPLTARDRLGRPNFSAESLGNGVSLVSFPNTSTLDYVAPDFSAAGALGPVDWERTNMRRGGGLRDPQDPRP